MPVPLNSISLKVLPVRSLVQVWALAPGKLRASLFLGTEGDQLPLSLQ